MPNQNSTNNLPGFQCCWKVRKKLDTTQQRVEARPAGLHAGDRVGKLGSLVVSSDDRVEFRITNQFMTAGWISSSWKLKDAEVLPSG
jgi:hypothetical protein